MRTNIYAHRGAKGTTPENTIAAFKEALRMESDGIELDVHLSKDREPVVIHDETVNRTTNGSGEVQDMIVADLKKLDAGSWFHSSFKGEQIPTLKEVLLLLKDAEFLGTLNIELKTDQIPYEGLEQRVVDVINEVNVSFQIVFSSFSLASLERMKQVNPTAPCALLFSKVSLARPTFPDGQPFEAWHPRYTIVPSFVRGKDPIPPLRVWTVNKRIHMAYCFLNGVDTIITDYPERAIKIRKLLQRES